MDKAVIAAALICIISVTNSVAEINKRHLEDLMLECNSCSRTPPCREEPNPFACQCDAECNVYDDCCAESTTDLTFLNTECSDVLTNDYVGLFRCNSLVKNSAQMQIAVYTISICPAWWDQAVDENTEIRQIISDNCNSMDSFPPVTDFETGLVFNNEFCALCHDVRSPILWSTRYTCTVPLTTILPAESLTPRLLKDFCFFVSYYPPPFQFMNTLPRFCTPSISTCLSVEELEIEEIIPFDITLYEEILHECEEGDQKLVTMSDNQMIFRNEYCALCNGYLAEDLECFNNMTHTYTLPAQSVNLILDPVNDMAHVSSSKGRFSSAFTGECETGSIFNSYTGDCQTPVCSFVMNDEPMGSEGCLSIDFNEGDRLREIIFVNDSILLGGDDGQGEEGDGEEGNGEEGDGEQGDGEEGDGGRIPGMDGNGLGDDSVPEGSAGSGIEEEEGRTEFTCQSVMVIEDASQYVTINRTLIFYRPLGVLTLLIGMTPNQLPIVCLDLAIPFVNPDTLRLFLRLQKFYGGLVFAMSIISALLCSTIVAIYLLRPMRSVFGVVVVNVAIVFLVSDVVIVLVGHSTFAAAHQGLCVFAAIAEQLINLALFVWLAILAVDVAIRYHRNANSLQPRSKKRVVVTYLLIGWTIPIALTGVGIAANFVSRGAIVQYGLEGSCHINHPQSALALLAIPDLVSIITAVVALVVILVLLCKLHFSFEKRDKIRFVLLFVLYLFLTLLWLIWFTTLGGRLSSFIKFLLPVLFLIRSVYFFFMVAFSKKVLNIVRGCFGVHKNKVSPSGSSSMEANQPQVHVQGERESVKLLAGEQSEQNPRSSFATYLENPMLVQSRVSAWQEVGQTEKQ